ncbi:TIGR03621 family F420-dependent LLM class oxidoreductase [Nonomuraea sp. B10E15]|uniref:TIGR03621 family F420-dependent LLM class oxidoreductase n=1 Tax=Nonomuraea sp. B10E15 TaxID=3153560 RepID=UPI00325CE697
METHTRPFRFGVNLNAAGTRAEWAVKCRAAERLGYDVIGVGDHLDLPAPFPALLLAAEVTRRPRVSTFVLNTGFYNPALLAREAATTDGLTGGRLEVGLGAGQIVEEYGRARMPTPTAHDRLADLEAAVTWLGRVMGDAAYRPRPAGRLPLLVAGRGDRLLRLAARHADIIAYNSMAAGPAGPALADPSTVAERAAFIRAALGARARAVELNVGARTVIVTGDRRAAAERLLPELAPHLTVDELLRLPAVLIGTAAHIAEQLREHRERLGFSYITVLEASMETFAPVIELLAGR